MKNLLRSGFGLLLVSLASGCGRGDATPAPTPGEPTTATPTNASGATLVSGDVVPTKLFARPPLANIAGETVTVSLPVSPRTPFALPARPEVGTFKDTIVRIAPGSSARDIAVPVDAPEGTVVYVVPKTTDVKLGGMVLRDFKVMDPTSKLRVDLREAKNTAEVKSVDDLARSTFTLEGKHLAGAYTLKIGAEAAKIGVAVEFRFPNSAVALEVTPSTAQFFPGDEAWVTIKLADGAAGINGAELDAHLLNPDGTVGSVVTIREVGNGEYRALVSKSFTESNTVGTYNLEVHAKGKASSGVAFDRFGHTAFGFAIPTGRMTSVSAPRNVLDEAGKVAAFEVDVDLEIASADRYELSGTLVALALDGTERPVGEAQTTITLDAGTHKATLRFDAGYAALTKLDGSYALRNLRVFSLGTNSLFHRLGNGLAIRFPAVKIADLAAVKEMTPALDEMITTGEFDLTKK